MNLDLSWLGQEHEFNHVNYLMRGQGSSFVAELEDA